MTAADEARFEGRESRLFRVMVSQEGGRAATRVLEVEGDVIHVGSHPSNEVVLDDARVSPFHCSLTVSQQGVRLTDSGSQHGTWVSELCVREAELRGDEVRIAVGASLLAVSTLPGAKKPELHPEPELGRMAGGSAGMRRLYAALVRAGASPAPLLLEGERGSGKTLAAQEVVRLGANHALPFVTVRCREVAAEAHDAGAASGEERAGGPGALGRALALSSGGTLLLEDVDELPPPLQAQLFGFLSTQTGALGPTPLRAGVRIIATSHGSLRRAVNRGLFRGDLYRELSRACVVRVPPLRERLEDIPLLIQAFLSLEHPDARSWLFTSGTLQELRRREWPGNVRELFEYVTRALTRERALAAQPDLEQACEPLMLRAMSEVPPSGVDEPFKVQKERLIEAFEREYLRELMTWAAGNVSRAARKARIDRMYLHRLLARHGIERRQFPS